MRILSARPRDIAVDSAARAVVATIVLRIALDGGEDEARVRVRAPIRAPGGAPLKARLIAAAKARLLETPLDYLACAPHLSDAA